MNLTQLATAGREPSLPLSLMLADQPLQVLRWHRVLPGQRYVAQASWKGRVVLAKLLVGTGAQRHFQRELQGAELLAAQNVPTPKLLAKGMVEGEGGWLLFEYLDPVQSLGQVWQSVEREPLLSEAQQAVLAEALTLIGELHARGLWQSDLHLDNLLRYQGSLQLIDGGGIRAETPGKPLSRDRVLENLGLFFGQLPAELEPFLEELVVHYLLANGEHALPLEALQKEMAKVRRWRLRDYIRKLGRDCSLFAVRRGLGGVQAVRREAEAGLQSLLAAPDKAIAEGRALKLGGSATVALTEVAGRPVVIKRYNIKGVVHWLKRFWRPSRAWHSWVEGNRLAFLGISTPRPLAVIERRWLGLRCRSFLITDYVGGENIISRFQPYLADSPPEDELQALDRLFAALLRERISHGDLKGTNLLWYDGNWTLIDLDALLQHAGSSSFATAYTRDRERFLRNWPADSALYRLLDERLPKTA